MVCFTISSGSTKNRTHTRVKSRRKATTKNIIEYACALNNLSKMNFPILFLEWQNHDHVNRTLLNHIVFATSNLNAKSYHSLATWEWNECANSKWMKKKKENRSRHCRARSDWHLKSIRTKRAAKKQNRTRRIGRCAWERCDTTEHQTQKIQTRNIHNNWNQPTNWHHFGKNRYLLKWSSVGFSTMYGFLLLLLLFGRVVLPHTHTHTDNTKHRAYETMVWCECAHRFH